MPERPATKGFCLERTGKYENVKEYEGILHKQLLLPKTIKDSCVSEQSDSSGYSRPDTDNSRTDQQYFILDEGGEFNSKMLENYKLKVSVEVKPAYYQRWARNKSRYTPADACSSPGLLSKKGVSLRNGKRYSVGSGKRNGQCRQLGDYLNIKTVYRFRPCKGLTGFGGTERIDSSKKHDGKDRELPKSWKSLDSASAVHEVTSEKDISAFCDSDSSTDVSLESSVDDQAVSCLPRNDLNPKTDDKQPSVADEHFSQSSRTPTGNSSHNTNINTPTKKSNDLLPSMLKYNRRKYESPLKSKSEASIPSLTTTPEVSNSPRHLVDYKLPLNVNKSSGCVISGEKLFKRECHSKYANPVQYSRNSNIANGRRSMFDSMDVKNLRNSVDCPPSASEKSQTSVYKIPLKLAQSAPVFKDPCAASTDFETLRVTHHLKKLRRSRTVPKSAASEPTPSGPKDENLISIDKGFKTVVLGFSMK